MIRKFLLPLFSLFLFAAPLRAEVPRVAADIAPVGSLVAMVMEGLGTPGLIVRHGASPHDYALRPSEAAMLEQARLVVWIGPDLAPGLARALDRLAGDALVLTLSEVPGTERLPNRDLAVFDAHAHDEDSDDHDHDADHDADHDGSDDHGHDGDHHHHGPTDPHLWLDPDNASLWLDAIAEALAGLDPQNAAAYRANARAGQAAIEAARADAAALLAPVAERPFIVFHDAYQYYEHAFALHAAGAVTLSDASAPGPARLAALAQMVREQGVACAFSEPQFNPGLIGAVSESLRVEALDPLGSDLPPGPDFYPALIGELAQKISACLSPD